MPPCSDTIITENIDYCPDTETAAGISPVEIYGARVSDFDTIAPIPALSAATSLTEAATIPGTHTFPVGKGFFKINILPETGDSPGANEGEKGSRSNRNALAGTLPGNTARNRGFIRKYQNVGMIFIYKTIDGQTIQLGSEVSPAYLTEATPSFGVKGGDINGIPVKFEDIQAYPSPNYAGTITEFTPPV